MTSAGGTNGLTNTGDAPTGGAARGALPGNGNINILILPASSDRVTNSGHRCPPQTDVAIVKTASPTSLPVGQFTTFTLTISNSGPAHSTAATVIDGLPTGLGTLTFFSASGSNAATTLTASNITANTFTGTVTIPVNQTLTVSIRATAAANGAPVNQATVFAPSNASDEALTNKVLTVTVVIGSGADLSAAKVASTLSLELGQITTFTLTFMNSGPSAVTDATLQDILPAVMQTLSFVSSAELNGAVLISQVTTSSAFNGTATIPVTTNLSITKTNAVTTLVAGQTTSYAITVNNNGPASADGTTVRDPVNASLSCTSVACSASGGAICPSPPIVISTFQGAGVSLDTFSASSSMVFNLVCGVTGTGR